MKNGIWGSVVTLAVIISNVSGVKSQSEKHSISKTDLKFQNWHNLDYKKNKTLGISTDLAYEKLLVNKKPQRVIVAVIDGGIDIEHEELKNKIWVNTHEIPDNGIDDDNNGFIDDIHGWNFLGNAVGENIEFENIELTRIYKQLLQKFFSADSSIIITDSVARLEFDSIKEKFNTERNEAKNKFEYIQNLSFAYFNADSVFQALLGKSNYTIKELRKFKTGTDKGLEDQKQILLKFNRMKITSEVILEYKEYLEHKVNYHLNTDFSPRGIVGDDITIFPGLPYGNNNVAGPDPKHGSFVAGIIAAERNNNKGIKGIADSVKIMVLRAVPDGDEYDKDIANAIYYAVNNGAQIINCSFGKSYSPQKKFVDEALKYACEKGVLIIHAAGNEAQNTDLEKVFPNPVDANNSIVVNNWITVGATSLKANKTMVAGFSNYGKQTVDLFAPGYRIYSTTPGNNYEVLDGTSFAAPMVTGAAALLKSVYPRLNNQQIKEIILKSGTNYSNVEVNLPADDKTVFVNKVANFGELSGTGKILNIYNALKMAETYGVN